MKKTFVGKCYRNYETDIQSLVNDITSLTRRIKLATHSPREMWFACYQPFACCQKWVTSVQCN